MVLCSETCRFAQASKPALRRLSFATACGSEATLMEKWFANAQLSWAQASTRDAVCDDAFPYLFDGGLPLVGRRIPHGDHDVLTPPKNAEIALEGPRTPETRVFSIAMILKNPFRELY